MPVYKNSSIEMIEDNICFFREYINLIRSAKKEINISTYILNEGVFMTCVFNELIKKAKSGVIVRLIYDQYGS
jgi:cardiolipin synthase